MNTVIGFVYGGTIIFYSFALVNLQPYVHTLKASALFLVISLVLCSILPVKGIRI